MRVDGIRFRSHMLFENGDGVVKLSLLHERRSLNHSRVCSPADFILNDCVGLVLQAGALDDECSQRTSGESANVGPVSHSGRLPEEAAVENFHKQPKWKQAICRSLKANAENQHEPEHLDLHLRESNQKTAHKSCDGARSTKGRRYAPRIEPSMNDRRSYTRHDVERGVNHPAPAIFEDKTGKPEKPHVTD